ncbi:DNA phosphorothioation-dependent restriction protein DptF [uncultured Robinsoniella sp.]|uniref:DNA phosphorothioation-dependent restriction protein DptF n=1 Tax=uncultured Robinsoniella sp. TaxID=904190 RepID=UPI00374EE183
MKSCKFLNELNRLRKSSSDSIDNVEKFDGFKEYMHVSRSAEEDLKSILRAVNNRGKKTLVLLCGSAGDGKSHLLSYLRNSDSEKLIDNYVVYNDATESSSPSKTAIETLNELLSAFKDCNLNSPGKNVILAINLGVLSNFTESEYGYGFSRLRSYVENSYILTSQVNRNDFDETSNFQHVSFSDYHMFSLTEEGIHAGYIEDILDKVFCQKKENFFYQSYINDCSNCPLVQKCPVKLNYEYLMDVKRQKYVAELLIETIIQAKVILTTREILNFIYDILVAQNFSFTKIQRLLIDDAAYLKEFMKQITPALIFDSTDVTALMNMLKKYDPLLNRSEKADEIAISYYVSSDISDDMHRVFDSVSYEAIICDPSMLDKLNDDKTLKSNAFNLMTRIQAIDEGIIGNEVYGKYLTDLYFYNAGTGKKLGSLYSMVEKAAKQWCGCDEDDNLCLDDKHHGFLLYEKVDFRPNLVHLPYPSGTVDLQRFAPFVVVEFDDSTSDIISLDIDYSLYELIYKLNHGYIQTADDRNNHADFISFVFRILQTGSLTETVSIVSKQGKKAIISQSMFGYKFKVVK